MPGKRVFDTRGAPEEEIAGVREVLQEHGIKYYETSSGNWGLGSAALWVREETDYDRARELIDGFQGRWLMEARQSGASAGINWQRVPALLIVLAAIAWVFYKSFQW